MFVNYMGVGSDSSELPADFISGKEEEDNRIDLNLGLSLNGKFGIDLTKDGSKFTNASPPSFFPLISEEKSSQLPLTAMSAPEASNSPILKAEKRGKRKELQLFSFDAKKNKIVENISFSPNNDIKNSLINSGGQGLAAGNVNENGLPPWLKSVGYRSMSSSGLSELEKQPLKAVCGNTETRTSPGSAPSVLTNEGLKLPSVISGPSVSNAEEKRVENAEKVLKNRMLTMPPVSAVGPNGRRVDGLLYRYIRGEDVQIVCVCHGSFLSPAEFVKHAGVDKVENPLTHIIVNPSVHQD